MSKYYTPEIEEFHVGFEYEHLQDDWDGVNIYRGTEYCVFELDEDDTLEVIKSNLEEDRIRVKYLDRADIESFGFIYDKGDEVLMSFKKDNICLGYRSKEHTVTIFSMDVNKDEYFLKLNVDRFAVNNITIKNKSELKKLLRQLKIIE